MPLPGRQLARHDGGARAVAILEDFQQIAALLILHGGEAPVVEDEDVHAGELAQEPAVGAVRPGELEVVEEAGGPAGGRAGAAAAGAGGERPGEGRLSRAGGRG